VPSFLGEPPRAPGLLCLLSWRKLPDPRLASLEPPSHDNSGEEVFYQEGIMSHVPPSQESLENEDHIIEDHIIEDHIIEDHIIEDHIIEDHIIEGHPTTLFKAILLRAILLNTLLLKTCEDHTHIQSSPVMLYRAFQ
jgi:hypothetical protein